MTVLDNNGRLLGRVNIIDAFVIFVLAALVIAGVALAAPAPKNAAAPTDVGFEATVSDAAADHLTPGLRGDSVTITEIHSTNPVTVVTDSGIRTQQHVTFTAALPLTTESGGAVTRYYWKDSQRTRVTIGSTLTLDFGAVMIDATVTEIGEASA